MKKPSRRSVILSILGFLLFIQVFSIDKQNPAIDPAFDLYQTTSVPEDVRTLLQNACDDCHSNETKFPWYTNIEPISWWIQNHIKGARKKLNFSEWENYETKRKNHKIEECIEMIENKNMPISSYMLLHKEAKLSDQERQRLVIFFESIRES